MYAQSMCIGAFLFKVKNFEQSNNYKTILIWQVDYQAQYRCRDNEPKKELSKHIEHIEPMDVIVFMNILMARLRPSSFVQLKDAHLVEIMKILVQKIAQQLHSPNIPLITY
jgi:hypothetical protein